MIALLTALLKVLVPFSVLSFIQNMAFTASSRSRNSGDPNYHRWCAYMSNGVYYITNALLTVYIIKYGALWQLAVQGIAYTLSTAEGSVLMMKKMLAKEKGKRQVGAGQDVATFTKAEGEMLRNRTLLVDTGDGVGTFTAEELAKLKELAGGKVEEEIVTVSVPIGDLEGYDVSSPISPSWQPKDIASIPPATPGQGAKL
jgi:hypothetical protein